MVSSGKHQGRLKKHSKSECSESVIRNDEWDEQEHSDPGDHPELRKDTQDETCGGRPRCKRPRGDACQTIRRILGVRDPHKPT